MTIENVKKFHLYPIKNEEALLYNEDPFFNWYTPEDFQKWIDDGWELRGCTRTIRDLKIDFVNCTEHNDCWNVFTVDDCTTGLAVDTDLCEQSLRNSVKNNFEILKRKHPQMDEKAIIAMAKRKVRDDWENDLVELSKAKKIVSAQYLQKKLDNAKPSSPFYHPFEGFDRLDQPTSALSWTVDGILPDQSLTSILGDRDSYKSFLATHLGLCVATGSDFFGRKTRQGPVLYFAPEGSTGIPIRRDAWLKENDWLDCYVPFYKRGGSFSFTDEKDREFLCNTLLKDKNFQPRLVIFDTLGQSLGLADENSASDINRIARFLNDLKLAHDCCFLWVDHSGHDGKRARGSSAKGGALDVEFLVQRQGNQITIKNTKMKDAPRAENIVLEAVPKHGSLILQAGTPELSHADVLFDVINTGSDFTEVAVRQAFYEACTANTQQAKQKAFQRALEKLLQDGSIIKSTNGDKIELVLTPPPDIHTPLL